VIEPVKRADREAFVEGLRRDYGPVEGIKQSESGEDTYVIRRIEPLTRNRPALGLDVGAEAVRREAIERAINSGEPALTGPVRLVQEEAERQAGFLYFMPIFSRGPTPSTPEERHQRLARLAYATIEVEEMFLGVGENVDDLIDCDIFDGGISPKSVILDVDGWIAGSNAAPRKFMDVRQLKIGGRSWTLCLSSRPKFDGAVGTGPWPLVAVGGGVLSVVLATLGWTLGISRHRAVALAQVMMRDLIEAKLAAENSLREVEALRGTLDSHAIVSVTDGSGVIIDVNDNFCQISGYSREELVGNTHAVVNSGHHPKKFWISMWKTVLSGNPWRGEVCNRAKDGREYWVDSMIAPFRGPDGRIDRLVSIRSDITRRKKQEQALREGSERQRFTGSLARVGWWEFDVASQTPIWSDQVRELQEIGPDYKPEFHGAMNCFDAAGAKLIQEKINEAICNQVPFDLELPFTTAKARALWVRVIGEPVIANGRVVSVAGAIQDISEQVRQRDAIRAQAIRMDLTVRASGMGTWNVTWPGGDMQVSDLWLAMIGNGTDWGPSSISEWEELVHPEDLRTFRRELEDHLSGKSPEFRVEHRLRRQDGGWVWVLSAGKVIERDSTGSPRHLAGVQIDLTIQKQAIAEVRHSRQQLRSLLDSAGEGIYSIDASGHCTSCNPAALKLLGFRDELDVLGKNMHELTHHTRVDGSPHETKECPIHLACHTGITSVIDHDVFWRADGTSLPVEYRAYPQFEAGKIIGVVILFTDVTAKLQLEQAAAEATSRLQLALVHAESANYAKSEFLANMSHEIRTPLTAILGYAHVLRDDPDVRGDPAKLRQSLDTIRTAGQHLMTIINDVLDISKIEAGKMTVERVETPLAALLLEIESLMQARAGAKGVQLRVVLASPVPDRIESDPTRLRQILVNLVGNAIKFTASGSVQVKVSSDTSDVAEQLHIDVEDTGTGMDSDQRDRLFEKFSQADGKVTREYGGRAWAWRSAAGWRGCWGAMCHWCGVNRGKGRASAWHSR
jgi:hypothetical protein